MIDRHDMPKPGRDTLLVRAPFRRGTTLRNGALPTPRASSPTALAVTEREIEMSRGGGVGIVGVIVIVLVILFLLGVIRL
jgi:hypothetical protein